MRQQGLFAKEETAARHTVAQGYGVHRQRAVFVNEARLLVHLFWQRVEDYLVGHSLAAVVKHGFEQGFEVAVRMNVHVGRAPEHSEGGNQSRKAEKVVAVQVRDEDVPKTLEFQAHLAKLMLRALAAVYHKQLFPHVHHLRRREMLDSGHGTAAAEYIYFKFFHKNLDVCAAWAVRKTIATYIGGKLTKFLRKFMIIKPLFLRRKCFLPSRKGQFSKNFVHLQCSTIRTINY